MANSLGVSAGTPAATHPEAPENKAGEGPDTADPAMAKKVLKFAIYYVLNERANDLPKTWLQVSWLAKRVMKAFPECTSITDILDTSDQIELSQDRTLFRLLHNSVPKDDAVFLRAEVVKVLGSSPEITLTNLGKRINDNAGKFGYFKSADLIRRFLDGFPDMFQVSKENRVCLIVSGGQTAKSNEKVIDATQDTSGLLRRLVEVLNSQAYSTNECFFGPGLEVYWTLDAMAKKLKCSCGEIARLVLERDDILTHLKAEDSTVRGVKLRLDQQQPNAVNRLSLEFLRARFMQLIDTEIGLLLIPDGRIVHFHVASVYLNIYTPIADLSLFEPGDVLRILVDSSARATPLAVAVFTNDSSSSPPPLPRSPDPRTMSLLEERVGIARRSTSTDGRLVLPHSLEAKNLRTGLREHIAGDPFALETWQWAPFYKDLLVSREGRLAFDDTKSAAASALLRLVLPKDLHFRDRRRHTLLPPELQPLLNSVCPKAVVGPNGCLALKGVVGTIWSLRDSHVGVAIGTPDGARFSLRYDNISPLSGPRFDSLAVGSSVAFTLSACEVGTKGAVLPGISNLKQVDAEV